MNHRKKMNVREREETLVPSKSTQKVLDKVDEKRQEMKEVSNYYETLMKVRENVTEAADDELKLNIGLNPDEIRELLILGLESKLDDSKREFDSISYDIENL